MQQPVSRRDVYEPGLTATVGGRAVDVVSAKVDRALPDPLAGGGLAAASVEFAAVEGADVSRTVATPWDPASSWPPVPEASVSVSMDAGAGPVSVLSGGRVVSASGGTGGREVAVEAADLYQSLDRPISWDGFADAMPALAEATPQRYVSLHAAAVTDRILRHCGWYATPPMIDWSAVFSVPAMGTMWPERGTVQECTRQSLPGYPPMYTEPWGKGVGDVTATYSRAAEYTVKSRGRVEMTAIAGRRNGGTMHLISRTSTFRRYRLSWTDSTASLWVTDGAGAYVLAASLPREVGSFLYATVEYVSDTSVHAWLQVDGASTSATVSVHPDLTTLPLTTFEISGSGVGGGFQVAFPSTARTLSGWSRNAVIYDRASQANALAVAPPVYNENCADLLAEQCAAQNATYWIDETGVLRWWDLARLEGRSTVASLNSDDDIAEAGFSWSHDLSRVKRSVSVEWREPLTEGGWRTDVDLWQGNGATVSTTTTDNPSEEWIKVPDDEVWIMPDLGLQRMGDGVNDNDFNYGWGSFYGAVVRLANGNEVGAQYNGSFITTIERVTDGAFKLATVWTGTLPAIQRSPSTDTYTGGIWAMRRATNLPILRGKKKYTLGERVTEAGQKGPATAPDHVISAGWWIQSELQAQITADYAAARLTVPQPVLSSIALIPAPGIQLGDMVEVRDDHVTRLTVRGIVVEDSRSIDAGMGVSHSVAIRPVAVSRNGVTWQEWASVIRPSTWTGWAASEGGTWQQWGSNPLNN